MVYDSIFITSKS